MTLQYSLEQLDNIATIILENTAHKTILFYGQMGSGKTTLIKALVKTLGVVHEATSPTFSLVNEYQNSESKIFHFDLYRIQSLEEALDFGIDEYLDQNAWIFIEWPEKIEPLLSGKETKVTLEQLPYNKRNLQLT
ncbi:tRNA (adenosine(37)-N6)-threonylcarbamoyltransferase complex ATPase subunit type 1 TsaE [Ascidiimonas sp. W6]|uniref:tRNA (adenosine(37)-N6)-threonylcarbamoyltransferase complex ATPase subunit type 1 TsaE n=1 Tax=Ascidiimonas meishanensis TaxID=3128903 RepID=UPI0030EE76AA